MRLVFALVASLVVLSQQCTPQGSADAIQPSASAQNRSADALPRSPNHAHAPLSSENPKHEFLVFDATLFKQKPDLTRYGLRSVSMVFKYQMWPKGLDGSSLPDRNLVREVAVQARKSTGVAILDIEHWPLTGDPAVVEDSISKYATLIQWFKEAAPSVRVGYYGVAPLRDYWKSIQPMDSPQYIAWQKSNDRVASIAQLADILFPSVYTFYEDQDAWSKYAIQQIREARRYDRGKPVYVFLWPQYHPANKNLAGTYLASDYWRMELEIARKYADGVVIWGGYTETWDETAPWWLETKKFLQRIGLSER